MKQELDPSLPGPGYDSMAPRWRLMRALLGGTEAMRAAGEAYLPKQKEEQPDDHLVRLREAVLTNKTAEAVDTLVSKPFGKPPEIRDLPTELEPIMTDADSMGNAASVLMRNWFADGLALGVGYLLVDMPRMTEAPANLAEQRAQGRRPYWVVVPPEKVLDLRFGPGPRGGRVVVAARILEHCWEDDPDNEFKQHMVTRVRQWLPGQVRVWRRTEVKGQVTWSLEDEFAVGIDQVPLVPFWAGTPCEMEIKPPLMDLAYLNVAHWQSSSDQRHILNIARLPILACSGGEESEGPVTLGSNKVLYTPDANGKFYYVEHTGSSISAGRQDLVDLEAAMDAYGSKLTTSPGDATATEAALTSADAGTSLSGMVRLFEDAAARALDMTMAWMNLPSAKSPSVHLSSDWLGQAPSKQISVPALQAARASGDLSHASYIEQLKNLGVLPGDFDEAANQAALASEDDQFFKQQQDALASSQSPVAGEQ